MDEQQQAQARTERTQERVAATDDVAQRGPRRWWRRGRRWVAARWAGATPGGLAPPLPPRRSRGSTTQVVASGGTIMRAAADRNGVWRYPATPQSVSPLYLQALLNYEDRWFWRHPGVNPWGLLRAGGQWIGQGRIVSGGSTLTMQVARILDPHTRTPWGKAKQLLRALQLEAHLSKREILTLYLERAPYGGTIEGVEAASWAYLGKPAKALSQAEAALLAVLP
ncbi:transglycosylase domain-containing protein, partial [Xanthomonas hortorum]|uniref:transglycosylase domain-containing protein n=1 Tax=Xanthomonas hortorum TaxID=56454 RepID=UPI002FE01516